ncbi:SagB family peptide dehydrogenase [Halobacillus massiliensis]|uniref:SagB family peptide dehydrogenase n=1 Tax=Halobacillus massiliensis TaxID=1926286 RepID=UPI0009E23191|nr:SagB family peptide dehydrogenase [Halobacillus massiliensis]
MELDPFLYNLHFQSSQVVPPDWNVDWDDAPLPFKIYRGLPKYPLSHEITLSLKEQEGSSLLDLDTLSCFLWYVFGWTQLSQTSLPKDGDSVETMQSFRRFAPSGGGLYPNELYLYLKTEELPHGIYHYDAAHHQLLLLREGDYDSYLNKALASHSDLSDCPAVAIISTMFWKNFFKYNNFSYRLQGLDAGVIIGQLQKLSSHFHFSPKVHFQFLDQALNHLLGLNDKEESIYAVVPLFVNKPAAIKEKMTSTAELLNKIPSIKTTYYQKSRKVIDCPDLQNMNQASMQESTNVFRYLNYKESHNDEASTKTMLPQVDKKMKDLSIICRNRYSPEMDFLSTGLNVNKLSSLFKETYDSFSSHGDFDIRKEERSPLFIYGCFYNVEGISDGAYRYDPRSHSLIKLKEGDFRYTLQSAMSLHNLNLYQVPLCLHIAGDRNFYTGELGCRGYRIQHMEAGALLQHLLLAASSLGMNGHPLLGFDVNICDQIYDLKRTKETVLIQIPVGFFRPKSCLVGHIHS